MGHSSLSAHDIPIPALLAALGVTAAAGWLAAGRRRGIRSFGAGLFAVQGALHLLFTTGRWPARHPHMGHQHQDTAGWATGMDTQSMTTGIGTDAAMLTVHLAAAVGCALWLAHGEAALFGLAHAVAAFAVTPLRLLLAVVRLPRPAGAAPRPACRTPRPLHGTALAHTLVRRGPPAPLLPRATAPGAAV
ncbi:hypothetical protein [Streptomyces sp. NPDC002889]|uniref:hypothetical protein n=1 Tax=Streptomyces sp. NPDC002889 TaxID=3364669 RepID=UPI0036C6AA7C